MTRSYVKSRSHYGVADQHTQPMSLPNINIIHLTVSEIWSDLKILRVTVTTERSYDGHTMMAHSDSPNNVPTK